MIRRIAALLLFALLAATAGGEVKAHALDPGFLELQALDGDSWRVAWRKPAIAGAPMPIEAVLPENCTPRGAPEARFDGRAFIAGWITSCPGGLEGGEIAIDGLAATQTDVLLRYELAPGETQAMRLTADAPAFTVPVRPGRLTILWSYAGLGLEHILEGFDHLLFVLALLLLIQGWRPLILAVTAFTLAHSITLAAATFGWIVVPAPPVEAVIALSIMFLAAELAHPAPEKRLTARYPWAVAFAFGLLHGLGFARALSELGLPGGDIPLALLAFNLGVEAGQLLFIAVMLTIDLSLARLVPAIMRRASTPGGPAMRSAAYAIGSVSAFWLVTRLAAF
jgi:hydrogenase/urease accessory protein HupE